MAIPLKRGFVCVLVAFLVYCLSDGQAYGAGIGLDTPIPEYILSDSIILNGTFEEQQGTILEDGFDDFSRGTVGNVTIEGNAVRLVPTLRFEQLNGGRSVLTGGGSSEWDTYLLNMCVIQVDGTYYMYYTAGKQSGGSTWESCQVGMAYSSDGLNWTKHPSNPVLRTQRYPGDPDLSYASLVVHHENGTFHMLYNRWDGAGLDINYARSTDGVSWTRHSSNPVIPHGATSSSWDWDIGPECVIKDGSMYRLYFTGHGHGLPKRLALATSTDLVDWTCDSRNPLRKADTSTWESYHTLYGTGEKHSGSYRLWSASGSAHTSQWDLGWVWSTSGVHYEDSGSTVLTPKTGTIYHKGVREPRLLWKGEHYLMLCACFDSGSKISFGAFKVSPERLDGSYTSKVVDAGAEVELTGFEWRKNVTLGGAIDLSIRWSNDSTDWSAWTRFDDVGRPAGASGRYLQYRADFHVPRDWMRPSLEMVNITYVYRMDSIVVTAGDGPPLNATFAREGWEITLDLEDGDYEIWVVATDTRGMEWRLVIPVKVDLYPPEGGISIEDGRPYHNSREVDVAIWANDTHGPVEMQLSRRPDLGDASWVPLASDKKLQYPDLQDGVFTLYARFRDAVSRVSHPVSDSVLIDMTAPTGTVLIDDGAKYTKEVNVTLNITWTDLSGVVAMQVSNDPAFEGARWIDAVNTLDWRIGVVDGIQRVHVRLRDAVGWTTDISDSIILDRTVPAATLSIDNDEPFTSRRDTLLDITLHDENPVLVKLANQGDPWPEAWMDLLSPLELPWVLSTGPDGTREVRMLVHDAAGNEVVVSDDILLDTTPPEGSLTIDGGIGFTNDNLVTITIEASDAGSGLHLMRVGDGPDLSNVEWRPFMAELEHRLPEGDGTKGVFVELMDRVGLGTVLQGSLVLDTSPPTGTVTVSEGADYVNTTLVSMQIDVTDAVSGIDAMRISNDEGFEGSEWTTMSGMASWELLAGDGPKVVFVQVRDRAGNVAILTGESSLDTTSPEISFAHPSTMGTGEERPTIRFSVVDNMSGVASVEYRIDDRPWTPTIEYLIKERLREGKHRIEVRATDNAGNTATGSMMVVYEIPFHVSTPARLLLVLVPVVLGLAIAIIWLKRRQGEK